MDSGSWPEFESVRVCFDPTTILDLRMNDTRSSLWTEMALRLTRPPKSMEETLQQEVFSALGTRTSFLEERKFNKRGP